jgi:HSP20 family protein
MTVRPDPLRELLDLQERMNRLFEQTLGRERFEEPALLAGSWVPLADVHETADTYVVEVELPGLARDAIEVQAQGGELLVRGERRPAGARPDSFHRLERRHGRFSRVFRFEQPVDCARITAELREGVLRLEVPKTRPRGEGRQVRVERSA